MHTKRSGQANTGQTHTGGKPDIHALSGLYKRSGKKPVLACLFAGLIAGSLSACPLENTCDSNGACPQGSHCLVDYNFDEKGICVAGSFQGAPLVSHWQIRQPFPRPQGQGNDWRSVCPLPSSMGEPTEDCEVPFLRPRTWVMASITLRGPGAKEGLEAFIEENPGDCLLPSEEEHLSDAFHWRCIWFAPPLSPQVKIRIQPGWGQPGKGGPGPEGSHRANPLILTYGVEL